MRVQLVLSAGAAEAAAGAGPGADLTADLAAVFQLVLAAAATEAAAAAAGAVAVLAKALAQLILGAAGTAAGGGAGAAARGGGGGVAAPPRDATALRAHAAPGDPRGQPGPGPGTLPHLTAPAPADTPSTAWNVPPSITGSGEGPLAGKTVAVKDNTAVAGVPEDEYAVVVIRRA